MQFTIPLNPVTKKNSSRIINFGRIICPFCKRKEHSKVIPSKQYVDYCEKCEPYLIKYKNLHINYAVNVKLLYYMKTKRKVDLPNLQNGTLDMLVDYGVLADDNRNIVYSTDGSRVLWDKENPRTEVTIEPISEEMQWWGKKEGGKKK